MPELEGKLLGLPARGLFRDLNDACYAYLHPHLGVMMVNRAKMQAIVDEVLEGVLRRRRELLGEPPYVIGSFAELERQGYRVNDRPRGRTRLVAESVRVVVVPEPLLRGELRWNMVIGAESWI